MAASKKLHTKAKMNKEWNWAKQPETIFIFCIFVRFSGRIGKFETKSLRFPGDFAIMGLHEKEAQTYESSADAL